MSDEPINSLIPIQDGGNAEAKPLRQNFNYLDDRISSLQNNISNKESTSNKNAAGGYCGLDNNGQIPMEKIVIDGILDAIYPVGSIYLTTANNSTCPIASLMPDATWVLVGTGKALWGGNGTDAHRNIAAGLPNITGHARNGDPDDGIVSWRYTGGAFYSAASSSAASNVENTGGTSTANKNLWFDASRSSTVYRNNVTTVQPPAYVVNIYRRTA